MSVDILSIGNNRRPDQSNTPSIINPWRDNAGQVNQISPKTKEQQALDRQVEVGLGSKIDNVMTNRDKQEYVDNLSDYDWSLMKLYKAEGYGFEASKALVDNKNKLANPNARGIEKYKDYIAKEQHYNNTGIQIDPDSALGKTALFLQKIGFDEQYGNPLNKLASQYNDRYAKERESVDTLMEDKEASNLEKIGWRLQRTLLSAESGIINSIAKVGNAGQGVGDIGQSAMNATLDRAILGLDTDMDFYREDDRRLDSYLWEGVSGGASLLFWAMSPKVMTAFTALGETNTGEKILDLGDNAVRWTVSQGLKLPGIKQYYQSLDEEGKENMLDSLTTGAYMLIMRQMSKGYAKFKTNTKPGQWIQQQENYLKNTRNLFKQSLEKGVEGAKEQIGKEVQNRRTATDLYDGATGKITGRYGEQGQTGIGKETSRVVQAGIDAFKKNFQEGVAKSNAYNAGKRGGAVNIYDGTQAYEPTSTETVVGKPTKGVVGKAKDIIQSSWNDTVTGLTPEERIRIQNDPYVKEKFEKARTMIEEAGMPLEESIITENLYNEIGDKIIRTFDERENKLNETSPEYKAIKQLNTTYNLVEASPLISDLLLKNDITMDPVSGELDFSNSKFVSDADMRSVQRAVDMIYKDIATLLTPRKYLNLRDKLNQLAKYATVDASRGQSLIRQIRHTLDGVAKKQIPGLKELDDTTSKYFKEIAELKDGWVYKGGDRKGEVRNNFYSIIKNLTGHNRKVMLQRLEKYYPGVTEEIEAVHLTEKLVKAYNKSPQIIRAMGVGGGIAGGSGGNILKGLLGAIIGEMAQEGIIRPITKTWRMKAIDKLLSEISPEAQAKLQEIALRQTYAKEMSAEDRRVLNKVAEIIAKERERGLSEEALKERENRTKPLDQEALPGVQPDIIDENGNIILGRGNVISPERGPGRPKRLTRINEINLKNPETTPDKQTLDLQEKLDVDTDTAREIQSTIDDFLKDVGADEIGAIGGREVNYEKFTTRSLEKLVDNENLPRTEKEKIKEILAKRGAEEEAMSEVKADWDFAMRIKQLSEEEQRIGKVGKNKVSKEVADKQMREREKKKEALIKEMQEYYGIDQFEASDKYLDMEAKGDQYIREYKRSNVYKTETAEREVLDRLMEGWSKQPKFVRDMDEEQLRVRQDFLNNVKLQNGYTLETTDYNDRYVLEDNGSIVDRGAIKYLDDGTIEITAQTFDGIKESGLLDYLPDNTEIKEAGSDLWMSARELKGTPLSDTWIRDSEGKVIPISEVQDYYDFADKTPIDKFGGELTEQQIQEGKDLYQLASESLTPETENEIIEARGKFLTLNQRPGYTKALGLDQGEVNKTIMSWQRMSPELKNFVDKVHSKADPKYRFMGISNWIERDNPWRGIDSLKFLTDDVKAVDKDPNIRSYELEIRDTLDGIMLGNSKLSYETLRIRLTHGEERNAFNKELNDQKAVGEFFSDIDMLIVGEGKETVRHEEGHYISSLLGRKILGNRKAFDKGVREATSRDWERRWSSRYKSPEVGEFHEKILKLVESLDKSMTPQMKNDNRIMSDGTVMKDYRAKPDEKWARFWSASIEFTKKIAQTGKIPTKTFKSEHEDEYSLKQYENLIDILQEYQRLEDKGLFYEVEVPNETGVNMRTGLKDIQQKSLFDQEPEETKLETYLKNNSDKIDILYKTYDPDIVERRGNLQKKGRKDITINELYEVKNMIDEHARDKGTQIDVPDGPTAQLLLEKAENMGNQKIGTYDKKQIEKITGELSGLIQGYSDESIEIRGATYNPDVDIRQKKIDKIRLARKQYMENSDISLPHTSRLTSLKAKIEELSKYSVEDINNAIGMTDLQVKHFMEEIKPRIEELKAKGVEDAVTNLVALSNMSVENFEKQMKNFEGKSPMPSIAVMDPNVPHEVFGDLTLVFGRDTVDPKVDPANKMYGSDAWTPVFPEIKDKGSLGDYDKVKKMSSDVVDVLYNRGLDIDSSDLGYFAEELKSQLLDLEGRADLDVNAERLAEQVFRDSVENLENDDFGIKNLSEKVADTGAENTVVGMLTDFIRESTEGEKVIPARYFDNGAMGYLDITKGLSVAERLSKMVSDDIVKEVIDTNKGLDRLPNKPETRADVEKYYQSLILTEISDVVQRIEDIGIEPWKAKEELLDFLKKEAELGGTEVDNLVSEIFGNGIAGDRPLTPENVLEAMKNQRVRRSVEPGTFRDMIEIEGTNLNDIEDVRRQNFAKVFHGDWTGDLGDLENKYYNILDIIMDEYIPYEEGRPLARIVMDAIKDAYDTNVEKFQENMNRQYKRKEEIPTDVLQRIIDVVEQGKKIPIRFSESKPERIVDLNKEVEYVLVSTKDKARVDKIVKGTPLEGKVVEYTPDNITAPRSRKIKELQKKYGNVFFSMGGVVMPIAMLYLMMQQEEEGQA